MVKEDFDTALRKLLDAGVPFSVAFRAAFRLSWRGADESVRFVSGDCVQCVCGVMFTFRDGAKRARCPGCGCRYERY